MYSVDLIAYPNSYRETSKQASNSEDKRLRIFSSTFLVSRVPYRLRYVSVHEGFLQSA